jgi:hypothetical protein
MADTPHPRIEENPSIVHSAEAKELIEAAKSLARGSDNPFFLFRAALEFAVLAGKVKWELDQRDVIASKP